MSFEDIIIYCLSLKSVAPVHYLYRVHNIYIWVHICKCQTFWVIYATILYVFKDIYLLNVRPFGAYEEIYWIITSTSRILQVWFSVCIRFSVVVLSCNNFIYRYDFSSVYLSRKCPGFTFSDSSRYLPFYYVKIKCNKLSDEIVIVQVIHKTRLTIFMGVSDTILHLLILPSLSAESVELVVYSYMLLSLTSRGYQCWYLSLHQWHQWS